MNERITLLALKASNPKTGWLDRQKFAELIVRECAAVAGKFVCDNKYKEDGISEYWLKDGIKEHFGVDE